MKDERSEYKVQEAGIRQGCPLSPYLFFLVMTVMFHDIYDRCSGKLFYGTIEGLAFAELLYADDTLLVLKNTRAMNILLAEIEKESAYYNLRLNKGKCNVISMNGNYNVRISDGTLLEQVEDAVYLGFKTMRNK